MEHDIQRELRPNQYCTSENQEVTLGKVFLSYIKSIKEQVRKIVKEIFSENKPTETISQKLKSAKDTRNQLNTGNI